MDSAHLKTSLKHDSRGCKARMYFGHLASIAQVVQSTLRLIVWKRRWHCIPMAKRLLKNKKTSTKLNGIEYYCKWAFQQKIFTSLLMQTIGWSSFHLSVKQIWLDSAIILTGGGLWLRLRGINTRICSSDGNLIHLKTMVTLVSASALVYFPKSVATRVWTMIGRQGKA